MLLCTNVNFKTLIDLGKILRFKTFAQDQNTESSY